MPQIIEFEGITRPPEKHDLTTRTITSSRRMLFSDALNAETEYLRSRGATVQAVLEPA
jgi:hypothetical protein